MKTLVKTEGGIIQALDDGHILTIEDMPPGEFERGNKIEATTMLQVWELLRDGRSCGFFMYSAFKVENKGGVLVTFQESKRGKAKAGNLVFRDRNLVLYDIPGCGSIAITTRVNDKIHDILKEQ
jgi:hypothetical protein